MQTKSQLPRVRAASLLLLPFASACLGPAGAPGPGDPTVVLRSSEGTELGVATDYGVLFLGHVAREGLVDLTAWFNDGPSWEHGRVEEVGGGLYVTEAPIRLSTVRLGFESLPPRTRVLVRSRRAGALREIETEVVADERVDGVLLPLEGGLRELTDEELGAGVFRRVEGELQLVGLVSGRLALDTGGERREYVTVVGPEDLWRVPLHAKGDGEREPPLYREDVL